MKRKFALGLLLLVTVIAIGGCAQVASAKDYRFVIVPKVVHPWFDEVNIGAMEQAAKMEQALGGKVTIDYMAPTVADVTEQNRILEQAAVTRPDGIAVDPLDAVGNKQVMDEIRNRGIPLIVFDSPSPPGSGITSVGNNFTEQGEIAAERLVELLGGKGKVAIMQGFPTAPNHLERFEAQKAVLAKYPGIEFVDGGISNDDIQTAQQQAAAVMAATPDLAGYLMCDAAAPIGIATAVKEAGKQGQVTVVGMDNLSDICVAVKEGVIESTASTIPRMQGAMSVLMMWQASIGGETPQTVDTGILIVTPANADEFITN